MTCPLRSTSIETDSPPQLDSNDAAMTYERFIRCGSATPVANYYEAVRPSPAHQGRDQEFLDAHKKVQANWSGLRHANMIKTGERTYCIIAEWTDLESLAKARPNMIATLDSFRDTLEDLGGGLGVTDPVSGPVVLALK